MQRLWSRPLNNFQICGLDASVTIWIWPSQRLWKFWELKQQSGPVVTWSRASHGAGREREDWQKCKLPSTCHRRLSSMMSWPDWDLHTRCLIVSSASSRLWNTGSLCITGCRKGSLASDAQGWWHSCYGAILPAPWTSEKIYRCTRLRDMSHFISH